MTLTNFVFGMLLTGGRDPRSSGPKSAPIHAPTYRVLPVTNLRAYARFVSVASYFIVEDTLIDLFRAGDGIGDIDGPLGAVEQFLKEDTHFQIDSERE